VNPQGEREATPVAPVREGAGATGEVRVLSLLQPWATLWVAGAKLIETRSWGTDYRGRVAVHASKGFDREARTICEIEPFRSVLRGLGFASADQLPRGSILGLVTITGCNLMLASDAPGRNWINIAPGADARLTEQERAFGEYRVGRHAWMTSPDRNVLPQPIPFKGGLGLRTLPSEIVARFA